MEDKKKEINDKLTETMKFLSSFQHEDAIKNIMWASKCMAAQNSFDFDFFERALDKLSKRVEESKKQVRDVKMEYDNYLIENNIIENGGKSNDCL